MVDLRPKRAIHFDLACCADEAILKYILCHILLGPSGFGSAGVDTMLEVNNGWVITDNTWLWKADHCVNSSGMRQK